MDSAHGTAALPAVGFPIRTSPDQSLVSGSPTLFAATHVLLRLLSPRHPSCALSSLVISLPCSDRKSTRLNSSHSQNSYAVFCLQNKIQQGIYLDYVKVFQQIKSHEAYQALPRKVSNQVFFQLHKVWVVFFEAMAQWREHPEQFLGRPQLPKYKHKTQGRNLLVYEKGAISQRGLKRGLLSLSALGELVKTRQKQESIVQARVVPRGTHYVLEVVYE